MAASAFVLGLVKCEIATEKMPSFTAGNFARRQIDGRRAHFVSDKTGKVPLCASLICMLSMGRRRVDHQTAPLAARAEGTCQRLAPSSCCDCRCLCAGTSCTMGHLGPALHQSSASGPAP